MRILVIDDNDSFCQLMALLLEQEGYTVDTALEAETALEMLDADPFDLLVVDLNLPGMHGDEFIQIAKQRIPTVKTILISAHQDVERYAKTCAADGAFSKMESVMQLCAEVVSLIEVLSD